MKNLFYSVAAVIVVIAACFAVTMIVAEYNAKIQTAEFIADQYKSREAACNAKNGVWLKVDQTVTPGISDICYGNGGLIEFHVW